MSAALEDLDAKADAALARLDAREDPTPGALPSQTVETTMDRRLVVERVTTTAVDGTTETGIRWHVLDPLGAKVNPREGVMQLLLCTAELVGNTDGWARPIWRAARNVTRALTEVLKSAPPPTPEPEPPVP